jgi:hypothetical protein
MEGIEERFKGFKGIMASSEYGASSLSSIEFFWKGVAFSQARMVLLEEELEHDDY